MSNALSLSAPTARLVAVTLLLLGFGARPAGARQAQNDLGVYDAVALAETNSPVINRLRAGIDAAQGSRWASIGLGRPTVAFAREGIAGGSPGFAEQRWVFSQSIDSPLESIYRVRRIDTEVDALEYELEASRRNLKVRVKSDYTLLLYARELVHLREQEVDLGHALIEAVSTRLEVGEAAELDLLKVEIQAAEAESNLEAAQRNFQNQRYALFNTIGLDPSAQRYSIRFPDTLQFFDAQISETEVLDQLQGQPELAGADRRVEASLLGVRQQRSSLLPGITVSYWPQDFGSGYDFTAFEIGLRFPLWGFLDTRGAVRQAKAEARQRRYERQGVYLDLKKQIEQTWHSYETSRQTIDRFSRDVRGRADELLQLTREGYQLGQLDLLTLLDAQRTYVSAQIRYYDALRDYYIDLIELERYLERDIVFDTD